jgi:hypothetical protein
VTSHSEKNHQLRMQLQAIASGARARQKRDFSSSSHARTKRGVNGLQVRKRKHLFFGRRSGRSGGSSRSSSGSRSRGSSSSSRGGSSGGRRGSSGDFGRRRRFVVFRLTIEHRSGSASALALQQPTNRNGEATYVDVSIERRTDLVVGGDELGERDFAVFVLVESGAEAVHQIGRRHKEVARHFGALLTAQPTAIGRVVLFEVSLGVDTRPHISTPNKREKHINSVDWPASERHNDAPRSAL